MATEVVVVFAPDHPDSPEFEAFESDGSGPLGSVLDDFGVDLTPILQPAVGGLEPNVAAQAAAPDEEAAAAPDPVAEEQAAIRAELARFFSIMVENDDAAWALVDRLKGLPNVETAYVMPAVSTPIAPFDDSVAALDVAAPVDAAGQPGDYSALQGHLRAAPGGVGIAAAWAKAGGRGKNVRVIDIEGGWQLDHVDLQPNDGLLFGTLLTDHDHGTAVLGLIGASDNGVGVTGIAPDARMGVISHSNNLKNIGICIQKATELLRPGDIILLEIHRPGPRYGFRYQDSQLGYIAVEWWRSDFLAIRLAILAGITVVEAAGNGAENLDDPIYDDAGPFYEAGFVNPFRGGADSGAILVGAGAPDNGRWGPDRSRLDFSNYGSRVDCQGWGRDVVSTGYGDLYPGGKPPVGPENRWYTNTFGGTSSASPIVTGAIACIQGICRVAGKVLDPARARDLLRSTGSPQQGSPMAPVTQRIGNRPDLAQLIQHVP